MSRESNQKLELLHPSRVPVIFEKGKLDQCHGFSLKFNRENPLNMIPSTIYFDFV